MGELAAGRLENVTSGVVSDQDGTPEPPTMLASIVALLEASRFVTLDQLFSLELAWPSRDSTDQTRPITE